MVKIHSVVLDTGLLLPSGIENLHFNQELEEPDHHRTLWGVLGAGAW